MEAMIFFMVGAGTWFVTCPADEEDAADTETETPRGPGYSRFAPKSRTASDTRPAAPAPARRGGRGVKGPVYSRRDPA